MSMESRSYHEDDFDAEAAIASYYASLVAEDRSGNPRIQGTARAHGHGVYVGPHSRQPDIRYEA